MISEKTYKKYKQLIAMEPVGILHILSGSMLLTHIDNTGVGKSSRTMLSLYQYFLSLNGSYTNITTYPIAFRNASTANSYLGMILPISTGYIFHVPDNVLISPTSENLAFVRNTRMQPIERHRNEFDIIPLDYNTSMRRFTVQKLTKEEMINEIDDYEKSIVINIPGQ